MSTVTHFHTATYASGERMGFPKCETPSRIKDRWRGASDSPGCVQSVCEGEGEDEEAHHAALGVDTFIWSCFVHISDGLSCPQHSYTEV